MKPDGKLPIEQVLQVAVATLAALGAVLLGIGERASTMALVACFVSVTSVYFTDVMGWVRLSQKQANVLASGALLFTLSSVSRMGIAGWLLPVANLCTLLQFILQYQSKRERHYWMIIILSLLQAAVATALSYDLIFGAAMLAYLPVGVATLLLFFLVRESRRDVRTRFQGDAIVASEVPAFDAEISLGTVVRHVGLVCAITLLLTTTAFLAVPRVGRAAWQATAQERQKSVGMSDQVELGSTGSLIENPETVMQIRFFDEETGEPYTVTDSLLFRGLHFARYDKGKWAQGPKGNLDVLDVRNAPAGAVRQEITIEPTGSEILYCVQPIVKYEPNDDILIETTLRQLQRTERRASAQFRFSLLTTGLRDGRQYPIVPCVASARMRQMFSETPSIESVPNLAELAQELVADLPADDVSRRARRLESYLRYSGEYSYSLNLTRQDPTIDPVEDFLFNTRQGHCEYFASALTLMLRSVGIPSRLVVGFKGGELNHLGQFYQVRQLHAHAWVEAYIPPDHLPADVPEASEGWSRGGWLLLDPTPAGGRPLANASIGFDFMALRQAVDYLQYLWSGFIVGMDASRQFDLLYRPLIDGAKSFLEALANPRSWREWISVWVDSLLLGRVDWVATVLGMMLLLSLAGVAGWAVRRVLRRFDLSAWIRWLVATLRGDDTMASIEFYQRLEALLSAYGLKRLPQQTPREFAMAVEGLLADGPATRQVAVVPLRVTDAYYRVRFGGRELDKDEAEKVEQSLFELKSALSVAH